VQTAALEVLLDDTPDDRPQLAVSVLEGLAQELEELPARSLRSRRTTMRPTAPGRCFR
jgi:hypothetical protein